MPNSSAAAAIPTNSVIDHAAVGQQHHDHREERPADSETLSDQVEQAAARGGAQSGAHLLDERK